MEKPTIMVQGLKEHLSLCDRVSRGNKSVRISKIWTSPLTNLTYMYLWKRERKERREEGRKEGEGEAREEEGRKGKRREGKKERKWTENLKWSRKHLPSFWVDDEDVHQTLNDNCILYLHLNCPPNIYKNWPYAEPSRSSSKFQIIKII